MTQFINKVYLLVLLFFITPFCSITQSDSIKIEVLEKEISSMKEEIKKVDMSQRTLTESTNRAITFSQSLIDWTAMIFGAITLIFLVAAIIGIREITQISNIKKELELTKKQLEKEIQQFQEFKVENQKNTNCILKKIDADSKSYLRAIFTLNSGIRYFRQSNMYLAEIEFREILKSYPDDYMANCYLARTCFSQGKYFEGNKALDKAIELEMNSYFAYYLKGENYRRLGDYENGIEYFSKAAEHSRQTTIFNGLGYTYLKKGDYIKSVEAFENSLAIQRNDSNTCGLAKACTMLRRQEKAHRYFQETILLGEEAVNQNPNRIFAFYNLAYSYAFLNQDRKSSKNLKQGLINGNNPSIIKEQISDYRMVTNENIKGLTTKVLIKNCKILESKISNS